MCVAFFGLTSPPPHENFCGRPSVAYLGFHFGGGGVQLITLKSGVIAWREKFLKRVVYINLITFVAAYIVAGGGVEGWIYAAPDLFLTLQFDGYNFAKNWC